jgi:hypothetical protein
MSMKANELRIGNYVTTQGEYQFELSDFVDWYNDHNSHIYGDYIKPIPLTEEWLLKLSAKSTELNPAKNGIWIECEIDNQGCWVSISHGTGVVVVRLDFVHQLQNLYYDLTGEELILK